MRRLLFVRWVAENFAQILKDFSLQLCFINVFLSIKELELAASDIRNSLEASRRYRSARCFPLSLLYGALAEIFYTVCIRYKQQVVQNSRLIEDCL